MELGGFQEVVKFMPKVFLGIRDAGFNILLIVLAAALIFRIVPRILNHLETKRMISTTFAILGNSIARWGFSAAAAILIIQQLGFEISSLWTVISAVMAMIAIGFVAVWSVMSNLLCTLMLIVLAPFRIGDDIELVDPAMTSGVAGKVRNINLMFTALRELESGDQRANIYIPNNLFFQKIIRCRKGNQSYDLDKQLFLEKSLLNTEKDTRFSA